MQSYINFINEHELGLRFKQVAKQHDEQHSQDQWCIKRAEDQDCCVQQTKRCGKSDIWGKVSTWDFKA